MSFPEVFTSSWDDDVKCQKGAKCKRKEKKGKLLKALSWGAKQKILFK